jgi:hypothetical protein
MDSHSRKDKDNPMTKHTPASEGKALVKAKWVRREIPNATWDAIRSESSSYVVTALAYHAKLIEALEALVNVVDPQIKGKSHIDKLEHFFQEPVRRAREVLKQSRLGEGR